jgi:hypothetical protein
MVSNLYTANYFVSPCNGWLDYTTEGTLFCLSSQIDLKGFFVSPFFLLVGRIFQIQYELNIKIVYRTYISWLL